MLSVILFLYRVAGNSIGIEHKKFPNIAQTGSADARTKHTGFKISDFSVSLTKNPEPGCVYGIHDLLDDAPLESINDQDSIVTKDGKMFLKGFETKITPVTLLSCYYDSLFNQMNLSKNVPIITSARDYYTKEKYEDLYKALKSIGLYGISVLPESTCAAAFKAESLRIGEKIYIVNFQGSQIVGSLFEIVEGDSKGKKVVKKTFSESIEGVPDSEIEKMVVEAIRECLEENSNTPKVVSLLPYEKQEDWWADISSFYIDASTRVNFPSVATYPREDQKFHNRDGTLTVYAIDLLMNIEKLRNKIIEKTRIEIPAIDGAQMHFLSYWGLREQAVTASSGKISQLNSNVNAILKGTVKLGGPRIGFIDDRAVTSCSVEERSYGRLMNELLYKSQMVTMTAVDVAEMRESFTFLKEEEFKEFEEILKQDDREASDVVGNYSLKYSKKLVDTYEMLKSRNNTRKNDAKILEGNKNDLMQLVEKCRALKDIESEEKLILGINEAHELLDRVDESITADDYYKQYIKLFSIYNNIKKTRKAEEDERRKQEEALKEAEKKDNPEGGEEPVTENGEEPAGSDKEDGSDKDSENDEKLEEFFRRTMPKDGSANEASYKRLMDMLRNSKKQKRKEKEAKEKEESAKHEAEVPAGEQPVESEKTVL